MFSRPVSSWWNPVPTSRRLATRPRSRARPFVGSVMRDRIFSSVDLPAPLRPMIPTISPCLADGATWIFGTGPRQTKPLDGMFNKFTNMEDQGLLNWSAIRGSNTDFNNNSRGVQGGCGFASDDFDLGQCFAKGATMLANPAVYDHGITQGASET
jgi:hypothetical protein